MPFANAINLKSVAQFDRVSIACKCLANKSHFGYDQIINGMRLCMSQIDIVCVRLYGFVIARMGYSVCVRACGMMCQWQAPNVYSFVGNVNLSCLFALKST